MSRRVYLLFAIMAVTWGIPYFFIKIAVEELSPASMVMARCAIASAILIPIAWHNGSLKQAFGVFRWVLVFAVLEYIIPWYLLGTAEQELPSSVAGLLLATTPLFATIFGRALGDKSATDWRRLFGLAVGFFGVVSLLGIDSLSGDLDWFSALLVLVCAACYVLAPMAVMRNTQGIDPMGIVALSMPITTLFWAGPGIAQWPETGVSTKVWLSLITLAVVCTWLAFHFYWQLANAVGVIRASTLTYLNPPVAIGAGVLFLGESITAGMLLGFPLVLLGSYYASRAPRTKEEAAVPEP